MEGGCSRTLAVEGISADDPLLRDAVDDAALDEHARPLEGLGRDGSCEVVGAVALNTGSTVGCERLKAAAMKKRKPHRARRAAPRASARGFGRVRVSAPMFHPNFAVQPTRPMVAADITRESQFVCWKS